MDFRYKPLTRVISLTVLLFFCWTFGGIFDIAYAIKNSEQPSAINNQQNSQKSSGSNQKAKTQKSEEKFQKTIDAITQIVNDTATDTDTKKNKLKTKKSEIESLDVEIKKQFADTEKKLKDTGLPAEILERHHKFVRHYEDNLKELNDNLDAIQKHSAKSKELSEAIEKTKIFLEKVKPPKKHVPLDPNKLPHRTAEPVFIEPRLNKEDFKEIQDARYKMQDKKYHASGIVDHASVLVASNGSLNGILTRNPEPETQNYIQVALADPPTDADLAETIEVKFTPRYRQKQQN